MSPLRRHLLSTVDLNGLYWVSDTARPEDHRDQISIRVRGMLADDQLRRVTTASVVRQATSIQPELVELAAQGVGDGKRTAVVHAH